MAISALSLAHRLGTQIAEALEHYAQALPAMGRFAQSIEDPYSDGPLFTHYLLLLYEVSIIEHLMKLTLLFSLQSVSLKTHITCHASGAVRCRSLTQLRLPPLAPGNIQTCGKAIAVRF